MRIKIKPEFIGYPAAFIFRQWVKSLKFEAVGFDNITKLLDAGKPILTSMWHNELFSVMGYGLRKGLPYVTIASDSKDGQYISEVLQKLDYKIVRGSSTRGGVKAMLGMVKLMKKESRIGGITVDGPKGPRHEVKPGIIAIAQRVNASIIPIRAIPENPMVFEKSWDRFEIPKPFSRCKIYFGEPFVVIDQDLTDNSIQSEADRLAQIMKTFVTP